MSYRLVDRVLTGGIIQNTLERFGASAKQELQELHRQRELLEEALRDANVSVDLEVKRNAEVSLTTACFGFVLTRDVRSLNASSRKGNSLRKPVDTS